MKEYIIAGVLFATSVLAFWMSIRSFREKGFLFRKAFVKDKFIPKAQNNL